MTIGFEFYVTQKYVLFVTNIFSSIFINHLNYFTDEYRPDNNDYLPNCKFRNITYFKSLKDQIKTKPLSLFPVNTHSLQNKTWTVFPL